jgi:hypothetical protein
MWGWMARTGDQGWLQGFITVTTFTTWNPWFRWDSVATTSGITMDDVRDRRCDLSNLLAEELNGCDRAGDPEGGGVIWSRVAEVSLLGALGCGSMLTRLVIEELEASHQYDYVVLQATDQSVPFYEQMGFVRVGAVALYDNEQAEEEQGESVGEVNSKTAGFGFATSTEEKAARKFLHPVKRTPLIYPQVPPVVVKAAAEAPYLPKGAALYWLQRVLRALLRDLRTLDEDGFFQDPVDTSIVLDYTDVVDTPMDFATMQCVPRYILIHYVLIHYVLIHYVLIHYVLTHTMYSYTMCSYTLCTHTHYVLIHYVLIHYVLIHYVLIHYVLIHYVRIHYVLIHHVLIIHYVLIHTMYSYTMYSYTMCAYTMCSYTMYSSYTMCSYTLCTHTLCTHTHYVLIHYVLIHYVLIHTRYVLSYTHCTLSLYASLHQVRPLRRRLRIREGLPN